MIRIYKFGQLMKVAGIFLFLEIISLDLLLCSFLLVYHVCLKADSDHSLTPRFVYLMLLKKIL